MAQATARYPSGARAYGTALELREHYDDDAALAARRRGARGRAALPARRRARDERAVVLERALPARAERTKQLLYFATRLLPLAGLRREGTVGRRVARARRALPAGSMARRIDEALRGAGARCVVLAFLASRGSRRRRGLPRCRCLREPGAAFTVAADGDGLRPLAGDRRVHGARAPAPDGPAGGGHRRGAQRRERASSRCSRWLASAPTRRATRRCARCRGRRRSSELLDGLLATSMLDAHASSAYPLDLSTEAARSLVLHAMQQALSAHATSVAVSHRGPFGLDAMVRDACEAVARPPASLRSSRGQRRRHGGAARREPARHLGARAAARTRSACGRCTRAIRSCSRS